MQKKILNRLKVIQTQAPTKSRYLTKAQKIMAAQFPGQRHTPEESKPEAMY